MTGRDRPRAGLRGTLRWPASRHLRVKFAKIPVELQDPEAPADPHDSLCAMTGIDHLGV